MKRFVSILALLVLTLGVGSLNFVFSQEQEREEQRIINTIPGHVPLKVDVVNGGMKSSLEDVEIRVTNTGNRSIFFLDLDLAAAEEFAPRNRAGLWGLRFGDVGLYDFGKPIASILSDRPQTVSLRPGQSTVMEPDQRKSKRYVELTWKFMEEKGYTKDSKFVLELVLLRFEDGTGYVTRDGILMSDSGKQLSQPKSVRPAGLSYLPTETTPSKRMPRYLSLRLADRRRLIGQQYLCE